MKKALSVLLLFALVLAITGCSGLNIDFSKPTEPSVNTQEVISNIPSTSTGRSIIFNGSSADIIGGGASVSGSVVTISAAGEYTVSGTAKDGQLVINTGDDPVDVTVHLSGVDLTNTRDAAIYVAQAKNVYLVLDEGTENKLVSGNDATAATFDGTQNGGVIFAEDDLKISGEGRLTVAGYINNGITGKDDVDITGGDIAITAVNNGIKGSESVTINGGNISINAGNDGIKSTSALKEGKGFVQIDGGNIAVTCVGDGISAETLLTVTGGNIGVESTGSAANGSCKALKAKTGLDISGGSFALKCADHAIHSAAGINISGGSFAVISTEGKAIAGHGLIDISGGSFALDAFDDGIETTTELNISGGDFDIVSGANGIKAGEKGNGFTTGTGVITVTGGDFRISAAGNPINSHSTMTVNGASFFGVGSSKEPKELSEGSQAYISCSIDVTAGGAVSVDNIASMTAGKSGSCVMFSDPALKSGTEYTVSTAGTSVNAEAK